MLLLTAPACASSSTPKASVPPAAITRERAIAIAKSQVRWDPFDVQTKRFTTKGRQIWRVTLKGRLPGQPPLLFETAIVEIDAKSGEVVSVART